MTADPTPPIGRYRHRNRPADCSPAVQRLYGDIQQLDDSDLRDLEHLIGSLRVARLELGADVSKSAPIP